MKNKLVFSKEEFKKIEIIINLNKNKDLDFKLIEQVILPCPYINNDKVLLSLIHIFIIEYKNELINFNILYTNNLKEELTLEINNDFFYNKIDNLKNILIKLNKNDFQNKDIINENIKKILMNIKNNINLSIGKNFLIFSKEEENEYFNNILYYIYKNYFNNNEENINKYLLNISEVFNDLFKKKYNEENFNKLLQSYNINFTNKKFLNLKLEEIEKKELKKDKTINGILERNAFTNRQLLIYSEKGTGKTYNIRKFIERNKYSIINIAANKSVDELFLKGHLIRDYDGSFKWKYGKLSLAFKKALKEKVIIFIDEFLRLPEETFDMLITAMDPYEGYYILDTGRPIKNNENDNYLETEELKVPISNLWFVCATNIGEDYNVEELESALKDRFILYHLTMTDQEKRKIITNLNNEKEFSNDTNQKLINFFDLMTKLYNTNQIPEKINLRHMSDIIYNSKQEEEIPLRLEDKIGNWINIDSKGNPIKKEKENILKVINSLW